MYDRAIGDYNAALGFNPNFAAARQGLETARNARR
jgi:hypothetical protein